MARIGPLVKEVTKSGNGAHVTVPKDLIGAKLVIVAKGELSYLSTSNIANAPGVTSDPSNYTAHATNEYGEEMVLVCPRKEPKPVLYHEDISWEPLDVMQATGDLVAVRRTTKTDVTLNPAELAWIEGCLTLFRVNTADLPKWKVGESFQHRMARAFTSGDRKKQIAILEEVLAHLKESAK